MMGGLCQGKLRYQGFQLFPNWFKYFLPPPVWVASAVIGQVVSRPFDYMLRLNVAQMLVLFNDVALAGIIPQFSSTSYKS